MSLQSLETNIVSKKQDHKCPVERNTQTEQKAKICYIHYWSPSSILAQQISKKGIHFLVTIDFHHETRTHSSWCRHFIWFSFSLFSFTAFLHLIICLATVLSCWAHWLEVRMFQQLRTTAALIWIQLETTLHTHSLCNCYTSCSYTILYMKTRTCEASRFDSNWTIPIRFKSDGLIRNSNQPHLPSYHKPCSLFNKKLVVIEIYFMFMMFM